MTTAEVLAHVPALRGPVGSAKGLAESTGDKRLEARALAESAGQFAEIGSSAHAMELYRNSTTIFREIGEHSDLGACLNNLGALLEQAGDLQGALATYTEAEQAFSSIGSLGCLTRSRSHQAAVHWLMGNHTVAVELWNNAADAFRMLGDEPGLAMTLASYRGSLASGGDQADVALAALSEAQSLFERSNDIGGLARVVYSRLVVNALRGAFDVNEVDRLIDLRRRANSFAGLDEQLLALLKFAPIRSRSVEIKYAVHRAIAQINTDPRRG